MPSARATTELDSEPDIPKLMSETSCNGNCDSTACLKRRYELAEDHCSCSNCTNSKTCLFYNSKITYLKDFKLKPCKANANDKTKVIMVDFSDNYYNQEFDTLKNLALDLNDNKSSIIINTQAFEETKKEVLNLYEKKYDTSSNTRTGEEMKNKTFDFKENKFDERTDTTHQFKDIKSKLLALYDTKSNYPSNTSADSKTKKNQLNHYESNCATRANKHININKNKSDTFLSSNELGALNESKSKALKTTQEPYLVNNKNNNNFCDNYSTNKKKVQLDSDKGKSCSIGTVKSSTEGSLVRDYTENDFFFEHDNIAGTRMQKQRIFSCEQKNKVENSLDSDEKSKSQSLATHGVDISHLCTGIDSSTAKLSAQIMNLPYKDFQNSLGKKSNSHVTPNHLTKYDVLNRIKEAYKACSCKVCECIGIGSTSNPAQTDACKCKPCECIDCRSYRNAYKIYSKYKQYPLLCGLKDSKVETVLGSQQACACKACDCIECVNTYSKEICNCKPCQCIECRSMGIHQPRTIIVAPVGDDNRRIMCTCTPCACFQCGHAYGTIATSTTHEMSTGVSRHQNCRCEICPDDACNDNDTDMCRCERRDKMMRKPVQRDTHDFDIRRAITVCNFTNKDINSKSKGHDIIAMFATLSNNYPTNVLNKTQIDCNCNDCECIVRKDFIQTSSTSKSFRDFIFMKTFPKFTDILNSYKCMPCEGEVDTYNTTGNNNFVLKTIGKNCDCLNCKKNIKVSTSANKLMIKANNKSFNGICKCIPCECISCEKIMIRCERDTCRCTNCKCERCLDKNTMNNGKIHSTEGRELLDTTASNIISDYDIDYCFRDQDKEVKTNYSANKTNLSFRDLSNRNNSNQDIFLHHVISLNHNSCEDDFVSNHDLMEKFVTKTLLIDKIGSAPINKTGNKCSILKSNTYMQCKDEKTKKTCEKNEVIDSQVSECYLRAISSCATKPRILYANKSDCVSLISKKKREAKSVPSSCNSSGHDYSNYLIKFPRTTVETYINAVMKLNLDKKLNYKLINVSSKSNFRNDKTPAISLKSNNKITCKRISLDANGEILTPAVTGNNSEHMFKNWKSDNICVRNPRGCDNFYHKTLKLDRCTYIACKCCGTCLSENQSISIRKNEGTQTRLKILQDSSQNSIDRNFLIVNGILKYMKTKCKTQLHPTTMNSEEFGVSRDRDSFAEPVNKNKESFEINGYHCWCYRQRNNYLSANNGIDILNDQINYESVQKTISQAKSFSVELIEILKKYEKANRDFVSVSQKLKYHHETLFNGSTSFSNKKINDNINKLNAIELEKVTKNDEYLDDIVKELQNSYLDIGASLIKVEGKCRLMNTEELKSFTDFNKTDERNIEQNFSGEIKGSTKMKNIQKKYIETLQPQKVVHNKNYENVAENITKSPKTNGDSSNKTAYENNDFKYTITRNLITDKECGTTKINSKKREITNKYKKYSKLIKRAVTASRKNNLKKLVVKLSISNISRHSCVDSGFYTDFGSQTTTDDKRNKTSPSIEISTLGDTAGKDDKRDKNVKLSKIMKQLDTVFRNAETTETISFQKELIEKAVSLKIEKDFVKEEEEVKEPMQEKELLKKSRKWSLLKKNYSLNTQTQTRKKSIFPSPLELEIKDNVQYISLQTSKNFEANKIKQHYENKALANLKIEVGNLLEMPQLQPTKVMDHGPDVVQTESFSAKSNRDIKKISFYGVRKVSDHTILVKWTVPQDRTDIHGYELLVDGRPVQKILSPQRGMAVITCLPHSDKVLLTVRPLTSKTECQLYRSTTIVYRPRDKSTI